MDYKLVIYQTDEGGVAVIIPSKDALLQHTIDEIAKKDVPAGKPYKIVSSEELPSDHTFFNAWEIDQSLLVDGVGAESDQFPTGG